MEAARQMRDILRKATALLNTLERPFPLAHRSKEDKAEFGNLSRALTNVSSEV